jgi:hypothetical protein
MGLFDTIKRGILNTPDLTPDEQAEIENARRQAKEMDNQLNQADRRAKLEKRIERIKQEPVMRRQRNEQFKTKAVSTLKGAATGLSKLGSEFSQRGAGGVGSKSSSNPFGGSGFDQSFPTTFGGGLGGLNTPNKAAKSRQRQPSSRNELKWWE